MEPNIEDVDVKAKAIMVDLGAYLVPLILMPSRDDLPENIVDNGSAALIDTGERKLLITCAHVWNYFKKYLKNNPRAVIGTVRGNTGEVVNVSDWEAISISENKDLAIIDLTGNDIFEGTGKSFFCSSSWPPPLGRDGDVACLLGFPGSEINKNNRDKAVFSLVSVTAEISAINERDLILVDQDKSFRTVEFVQRANSEEFRFGGMSGGPAFVYIKNRWEFGGIIYSGEVDWSYMIFARLAGCISSGGKILESII